MAGLLETLLAGYGAPTPGFGDVFPPIPEDEDAKREAARRPRGFAAIGSPGMLPGLIANRRNDPRPVAFPDSMAGAGQAGSVAGDLPQVLPQARPANDLPPSTNDPASSEPVVFSGGVPMPRPRPVTPNTPASVPDQVTDASSANVAPGAPLSIAPPAAGMPQAPGTNIFGGGNLFGDGMLGKIFKPENAPLFMALGGGLSGAPSLGTGMRRALTGSVPAAMQMQKEQKSQQSQAATYRALIAKGVPPGEAMAAVLNPDVMKATAAKYFETKPLQHVMSEDMFGNKRPMSFDQNTGKWYGADGKPVAAAAAEGGGDAGGFTMPANVDATLVGDDYLKQFPSEVQSAVRNYVRGDSMPTGNPRKGFTQAVKMIAQKYGEDTGIPVSDQKYVERRQYRNQLASGNSGVGAQRNALRQGLEHLESVTDSAAKLENWDTGVTFLNTPINTMRGWSSGQQAKVNAMKNTVQQLSGEIGKFFSGSSGGGIHEREETRKRFNAVSSPQELAAAIESSLDLLEGGLHAREQQRDEILGPNSNVEILSAKDRERVTRIRELATKLRGGEKTAPAAPAGGVAGPGKIKWSVVQ